MKSLAIKLSKVCNDLRLLSSGPRCGLREINLPPKQPGSSIMPGKVNPVIPEVVNMVCFRVIGSDQTITMAAEAGQLQLNVFEPVIAACIFEAQTMFINAARTLRVAVRRRHHRQPRRLPALRRLQHRHGHRAESVIGYDRATELAAEAAKTGRGILELVREKRILSDAADRRGVRSDGDDRPAAAGVMRRAALVLGAWMLPLALLAAALVAGAAGAGTAAGRLARVSGQLVGCRPAADAAHRRRPRRPPSSSSRAPWC